jgi:hypothetical protein
MIIKSPGIHQDTLKKTFVRKIIKKKYEPGSSAVQAKLQGVKYEDKQLIFLSCRVNLTPYFITLILYLRNVAIISYSGGPRFKYRPADRYFDSGFSCLLSFLPGKCRYSTLKLVYNRFLPHPFQFIVYETF